MLSGGRWRTGTGKPSRSQVRKGAYDSLSRAARIAALGCFIRQRLGHEKLETSAIHTEVSIEQLKAVHARTPGES